MSYVNWGSMQDFTYDSYDSYDSYSHFLEKNEKRRYYFSPGQVLQVGPGIKISVDPTRPEKISLSPTIKRKKLHHPQKNV